MNGKWIGFDAVYKGSNSTGQLTPPPRYLRKEFTPTKRVKKAELKADAPILKMFPRTVLNEMNDLGGPCWADAGVIIPWALYEVYGDVDVLENQYESMKKCMIYRESKMDDAFRPRDFHSYGDWLNISADTPDEVIQGTMVENTYELNTNSIWMVVNRGSAQIKIPEGTTEIRLYAVHG